MKLVTFSKLGLVVASTLAVGCGSKNFEVANLAGCDGCLLSKDKSADDGLKDPITFIDADLQGTAVGGANDKAMLITFNKTTKMFQIKIPIAGLNLSVDQTIPQIPGSHVSVIQDNLYGNGLLVPVLFVQIPGVYVLGKLGFEPGDYGLDPRLLPNGDLIPPTPGGEGPRISFLIPNINHVVRLYLGVNVVGVFVEAKFVPSLPGASQITYPIKNKSKNEVIGYTSLISKESPFNGGFFVSLVMPRSIAGALDDYLSKVIVNEATN